MTGRALLKLVTGTRTPRALARYRLFVLAVSCLTTVGITSGAEAVNLPQYYGLYAISDGDVQRLPLRSAAQPKGSLPKRIQFLLFDKNVASLYPRIHLVRMKYVRQILDYATESFGTGRVQITPVAEWRAVFLEEEKSEILPLSAGPIAGQSEMVRLVPPSELKDGAYALVLGPLREHRVGSFVAEKPDILYAFFVNVPDASAGSPDCIDYVHGSPEGGYASLFQIAVSGMRSAPCQAAASVTPSPKPTDPVGANRAPPSQPPPMGEATHLFLRGYPVLGQRDPDSYRAGSVLLSSEDYTDDPDNPDEKKPVRELACAAAVYTMIERGRGLRQATIDDVYQIGRGQGAQPWKLKTVVVGPYERIDLNRIQRSLEDGLSVILHGTGGPLGSHFVLVVGIDAQVGGVQTLHVNDPWVGKRRTLDATSSRIHDAKLNIDFDEMRLVSRKPFLEVGPINVETPVRIDGIGPLVTGMTLGEAEKALGVALLPLYRGLVDPQSCSYAALASGPPGLSMMVQDGAVVARLDIETSDLRTVEGAHVGSTEFEITKMYGGASFDLEVGTHKYEEKGHYMVVTMPQTPRYRDMRLVFETDGRNVTRFRSGRLPEVMYVEHCL